MHKLKKIGLRIALIILVLNGSMIVLGYDYLWKAILYNFPGIYDYRYFPNGTMHKSPTPQPWDISEDYNTNPLEPAFKNLLLTFETTAYLVIQGNEIKQEYYWNETDENTISNSFSAAKSFVSTLIGIAIQEGHIESVDQKVGDFLDDFKRDGKQAITIKHLLQMSSGLTWEESYSGPFSITTEAYYGDDLEKTISTLKAAYKPGTDFVYRSGDTQILGLVIRKATGYSLYEYANLKLWGPLGFEHDALWSLDKELGTEKAFCCINSTARDFARLPRLYLNKGKWNGKQILNEKFINEALTPSEKADPHKNTTCNYYGYQWWLIPDYKGHDIFYARGILGQFMIAIPALDIIIVRMGHKRGKKQGRIHHKITYAMIDEAIKLYG